MVRPTMARLLPLGKEWAYTAKTGRIRKRPSMRRAKIPARLTPAFFSWAFKPSATAGETEDDMGVVRGINPKRPVFRREVAYLIRFALTPVCPPGPPRGAKKAGRGRRPARMAVEFPPPYDHRPTRPGPFLRPALPLVMAVRIPYISRFGLGPLAPPSPHS